MSVVKWLKTAGIAAGLFVLTATPAQAQISGVEIGTSLASVTFDLEDNGVTIFGVPSGGFGILNPTLYGSVFLGDRFSIEPQLGLVFINGDDDTSHFVSFNAQANYFFRGNQENSLYVFGGAGIIDVSDVAGTLNSVSAGAGYRVVLGDRLTMRFDGRYTHFTDNNGNALSFTVSLGGMFGR